jgi:hypothetical protein
VEPRDIILFWLILAGVVGWLATTRGKGFWTYFLLSVLLSPLIGLIILLVTGGDGQQRAACWQCKEKVVVGASKCPHCGAGLTWNQPAAPKTR